MKSHGECGQYWARLDGTSFGEKGTTLESRFGGICHGTWVYTKGLWPLWSSLCSHPKSKISWSFKVNII